MIRRYSRGLFQQDRPKTDVLRTSRLTFPGHGEASVGLELLILPHHPHRMELSGTTGSEPWFRAPESVAIRTQVNRNSSQGLGLYQKAMRRPEERRIFTSGQDE